VSSVAPITAHAAFDKAAHYFDIKLVLFLNPHEFVQRFAGLTSLEWLWSL